MNKLINSITRRCFQPAVGQRPLLAWTSSCTSECPKPRCLQNGQAPGAGQKLHMANEGHIHSWVCCPSSFYLQLCLLPKELHWHTQDERRGHGSHQHPFPENCRKFYSKVFPLPVHTEHRSQDSATPCTDTSSASQGAECLQQKRQHLQCVIRREWERQTTFPTHSLGPCNNKGFTKWK